MMTTKRTTILAAALLSVVLSPTPSIAQETVYPIARLVDPIDPTFEDQLGWDVVGHGEYVISSAIAEMDPGAPCGGHVFVFRQTAAGFELVQEIRPPYREDCHEFFNAHRIEVCGDYLFISAGSATLEVEREGMVRVYRRTANGYVPTQILSRPPGMQTRDFFGSRLVANGGRLYVSAFGRESNGIRVGAIFIYREQGGIWILDDWFRNEVLVPPGNSAYVIGGNYTIDQGRFVSAVSQFKGLVHERLPGGWTDTLLFDRNSVRSCHIVSSENGWLAAGDATEHTGSFAAPGSVRMFRWDGTDYEYMQNLVPSAPSMGPGLGDVFGGALDMRGDELLIGARGRARNGVVGVGGAYLFERVGTQWIEKKLFLPPPSATEEGATGGSVKITESAYLVGGRLIHANGIAAGGVYVFERAFGEPLCAGNPNSTGQPGTLEAYGNSAFAAEALELRAKSLPSSTFVLLATGQSAAQSPMLGGGQGTLCIAASGIRRLGVTQVSTAGEAQWPVDFTLLPGSPGPGETYHFQAWYRDLNPAATSNLTEGVSVTLK